MAETVETPLQDVHLLADNTFLRLGEFFGFNDIQEREENKENLKIILEWAKETSGSDDPIDILLHIRSIERQMIKNDPSEDRVKRLHRYIAVEENQKRVNKEMELLTGQVKTNE